MQCSNTIVTGEEGKRPCWGKITWFNSVLAGNSCVWGRKHWVKKRALTFMSMNKHLSSHIAHFMRYKRRKWKHLIGWNRLAQCHRVLNRLRHVFKQGQHSSKIDKCSVCGICPRLGYYENAQWVFDILFLVHCNGELADEQWVTQDLYI